MAHGDATCQGPQHIDPSPKRSRKKPQKQENTPLKFCERKVKQWKKDICHNNMVLSCVIGHKRGRTNHSSHASKAEELRSPGTWGESRPRRKRQDASSVCRQIEKAGQRGGTQMGEDMGGMGGNSHLDELNAHVWTQNTLLPG
ncbi:hypothetical protein NQZ68_005937 [Dissostichus eleginoides]|nr:hypothetical protein NQZ68_005937 [Dissostichus eleginoides]